MCVYHMLRAWVYFVIRASVYSIGSSIISSFHHLIISSPSRGKFPHELHPREINLQQTQTDSHDRQVNDY